MTVADLADYLPTGGSPCKPWCGDDDLGPSSWHGGHVSAEGKMWCTMACLARFRAAKDGPGPEQVKP